VRRARAAAEASPPRTCPRCASTAASPGPICLQCGAELASGRPPARPEPRPAVVLAPDWEAVVTADEAYFHDGRADGAAFPAGAGVRVFRLTAPSLLIGRRDRKHTVELDIDLAEPPEDLGVSAVHAALERRPDGSYTVIDLESRNGTRVNEEPPLQPGQRRRLRDGDRIYLGSWSRILIRVRRG
jgi:hypothetical protein